MAHSTESTTQARLASFVAELRRRHVVRAVIAYAAVFFVVLQGAEIILPAFLADAASAAWLRVLVVGFTLAFPVVAALAWVYEITPQGIRTTAELDGEDAPTPSGHMLPRLALLAVTLATTTGAGLWWYRTGGASTAPADLERGGAQPAFVAASTTDPSSPIRSLAVLPLDDFSPQSGEDSGYFAAGMHEALISQISQLGIVRVISRTSVQGYVSAGKSLPQVAQELGVDAVVEGSVVRASDRVRVTVQLIHAASDTHLWSSDYEGDLRDVLGLQREVASAIADEIRSQIRPRAAEPTRIAMAGPTPDEPDAGAGDAPASAVPAQRSGSPPGGAGGEAGDPGAGARSSTASRGAGEGAANRAGGEAEASGPATGGAAKGAMGDARAATPAPAGPDGAPAPAPSADPQTFENVFRGRYALQKNTPEETREAERYFAAALEADSAFAPALTGLAGTRLVQTLAEDSASVSGLLEAWDLAQRALEVDPSSAEAQEVLASAQAALLDQGQRLAQLTGGAVGPVQVLGSTDSLILIRGTDSLSISREMDLGSTATELGRFLQLALARGEMEGRSSQGMRRAVRRLEAAGRHEEALRLTSEILSENPQALELWDAQAHLCVISGDLDGAVRAYQAQEARLGPGPGPSARELAEAVEEEGVTGYWRWRLARLDAQASDGIPVSHVDRAAALTSLGRTAEAMDALAEARAARDPRLVTLRNDPTWDPLRPLPRFQRFVAELRTDLRRPPPPPRG